MPFRLKGLFLQCASRLVAVPNYRERGKSGQQRAPYFLTGRDCVGDDMVTDSATENIPPVLYRAGKGEKVG